MTILYLTEDYFHSKVHNNLLFTLLEKDLNLKIYVFSPIRWDEDCGFENSYKQNERLKVITPKIDIPAWRYKYDFIAKQRCKLRLIEAHVPVEEINVVHAATLYVEGYTALQLKKKYNIPYFVSIRGSDAVFYSRRMPHLWNVGISVMKHATKLACVTPCIKEKMISAWQHKSVRNLLRVAEIVNNGIENFWLENISATPREIHNPVKLLYIGRFDSNKNVYRLIQALKKVRKSVDVRLTIVGGVGGFDKEHEAVMKEVEEHPDYIKYLGAIYDKHKLINVVRQSDFFAMVSHSETFGLVYAECLTQGLPLLYTRGTGFDGMYPDGLVGYAVDSKSVEDIASGIKRIVQNYSSLRNNICQLNFERFSWSFTSMKYLEYYNNYSAKG